MNKLQDKVAIVTGASSGLGFQIAKRYVAEGAKVALCDINLKKAEDAAHELGENAIAVKMDVSNEDAVNNGIDSVADKWGGVDILVSNAGIQIVHPIEEFSYKEWQKMISIHLDGAFLTTKACVKHMYPKKSGSLIYMGSVHRHEASPLKSAYWALRGSWQRKALNITYVLM